MLTDLEKLDYIHTTLKTIQDQDIDYNRVEQSLEFVKDIREPLYEPLKALKEASISIACVLDEPTDVTIKDLEYIQNQITITESI